MDIGHVKLLSIKLTKYDRLADFFEYECICKIEGEERRFLKQGKPGDVDSIVKSVIDEIKEKGKITVELWDNSSLDTVPHVDVENLENAEKQLNLFFRKVNDKILQFKQNRDGQGYLDMYYDIVGSSISFE